MSLKPFVKVTLAACLTALTTSVAGCGGFDGVQLNGKIFDAVGLNTGSVESAEPKLAARQPLVVPPGLESLPPPGSGNASQPALAGIVDPDLKKVQSQADLEKEQAAYCKVHYEDAVVRGDASADSVSGPLGSCHPSVFSGVKKIFTPSQETGDEDIR